MKACMHFNDVHLCAWSLKPFSAVVFKRFCTGMVIVLASVLSVHMCVTIHKCDLISFTLQP